MLFVSCLITSVLKCPLHCTVTFLVGFPPRSSDLCAVCNKGGCTAVSLCSLEHLWFVDIVLYISLCIWHWEIKMSVMLPEMFEVQKSILLLNNYICSFIVYLGITKLLILKMLFMCSTNPPVFLILWAISNASMCLSPGIRISVMSFGFFYFSWKSLADT